MFRSLLVVWILLAIAFPLPAQSPSSDNCDLSVRVVSSDDRSIDTQIQIDVLSPEGTTVATGHVAGDEPARFRVSSARTYRLRVSGIGIQPLTTSYFVIDALEQTHSELVHVTLDHEKQRSDSPSRSPTISISEMTIPKKARAEMDKGMDAYSKEDFAKAAAHFDKAISEYPQYARAYNYLGIIAIKQSDRNRARAAFSKSIQADDKFLQAYVNLARMDVQDQKYADSESLLNRALAMNPFMPDALSLLAATEFANKEYDKALIDVQRTHALPGHEQFADVHAMAGKVLAMQNHPHAAIAQFQLFLQEKPGSPEAESIRKMISSLEVQQP